MGTVLEGRIGYSLLEADKTFRARQLNLYEGRGKRKVRRESQWPADGAVLNLALLNLDWRWHT